MPLHDWTRVSAGIFHYLHLLWIGKIGDALNDGLLPKGLYALGEEVAGGGNPDVIALHEPTADDSPDGDSGGTAVLTATPRTQLVAQAEREQYTDLQRRLVIRHASGDRVVAMIELVSAGNEASEFAFEAMMNKSLAALSRGIHLLVADLHPPTPRDPAGFHGALRERLNGTPPTPHSADRTLAAYSAGLVKTAYVEPVAVGQVLRDMPLFLTPDGIGHIEVPLEATYMAAFAGVPQRFRRDLE